MSRPNRRERRAAALPANDQAANREDADDALRRRAAAVIADAMRPDGSVGRLDRWVNPSTGLGTLADKTRAGFFDTPFRLTDVEITNLVNGNDLAAKSVEKRPTEMFRRGYELESAKTTKGQDIDKSDLDALHTDATERLELDTRFQQGMTFGRQYGGSLCYFVINDGRNPWEPVDEDNIQSIDAINQIDRRFSYVQSYYSDYQSPKYGQPQVYLIANAVATSTYRDPSTNQFGIRKELKLAPGTNRRRTENYAIMNVHETRVIRFDGVYTDIVSLQLLAGWSWSILQRSYEVLRQCDSSFDALCYLISDASQGVLKLRGLFQALTSGNKAKLEQRLKLMEESRSVMRAIALDAGSPGDKTGEEDFQRIQTPLTGIPESIDRIMQRLAAAFDMPVTEVFGISPAGLNATGESDRTKWYDTIANEQTKFLTPRLRRAYRLMSLAKRGPLKGRSIDVKVHHRPLYAPTEQEIAKTRLINAQRDQLYATGSGMGAVTPEQIALTLTDVYPSIDVEAIEAEIEAKTVFNPYENEPPPEGTPSAGGGTGLGVREAQSPTIPIPNSQTRSTAPAGEGRGTPGDQGTGGGKGRTDAWRTDKSAAIADAVHAQLADDYPPEAIAWVKGARWRGPVRVPLDRIDFSGRERWNAFHDKVGVAAHKTRIAGGIEKPIILVRPHHAKRYMIVDGHHRSLAYEGLGRAPRAYVADVDAVTGPWDTMHSAQREGELLASAQTPRADALVEVPDEHLFGMRVPVGGSSCAKCRFLAPDREHCENRYFQRWRRSVMGAVDPTALPVVAEQYCCDVFEPGGGEPRSDDWDESKHPRDPSGRFGEGGGGSISGSSSADHPTHQLSTAHRQIVKHALANMAQQLRAAPGALAHGIVHEIKEHVHEAKEAVAGVKAFFTGHRLTDEQKSAIKKVAVTAVTAVIASHLTALLPLEAVAHGALGTVVEKAADQVVHHVLETFTRRGLHLDAAADPEEWLARTIATAAGEALAKMAAETRDDASGGWDESKHPRDPQGRFGEGGGALTPTVIETGRPRTVHELKTATGDVVTRTQTGGSHWTPHARVKGPDGKMVPIVASRVVSTTRPAHFAPEHLAGQWTQHGPTPPAEPHAQATAGATERPAFTPTKATPEAFGKSFAEAFRDSPFKDHVTHYSAEDLGKMKALYLTPDGKAGVAVHDHGDGRVEATALFNAGSSTKGAGLELLRHAIKDAGVNYVECYGPKLNQLYETVGFKPTSDSEFNPEYASKTWDYARFDHPHYYTMKLG